MNWKMEVIILNKNSGWILIMNIIMKALLMSEEARRYKNLFELVGNHFPKRVKIWEKNTAKNIHI